MVRFKAGAAILAAVVTLAVAGCGSSSKSVQSSAITADLTGLVRDNSSAPTIIYKRPGAPTFAAYNKFIVEPPRVDYTDPKMKELSPRSVRRMQLYFYDAVIKELREGGYTVGTRTEPNTMRISFVISGLKAPNAMPNIVAAFAPVAISVDEVTVEGIFSDAVTRRIDAVALDRAAGSRVLNSKPWSTWADVESAFDTWAEGIRGAIDKANGR